MTGIGATGVCVSMPSRFERAAGLLPASSQSRAVHRFMGLARSERLPTRALFWIPVLIAYGVTFTLLRVLASHWQTQGLFSLWFPAAGLRFAFIWTAGARITPAAALAELMVSAASGTVAIAPGSLLALIGVLGPCLVYGGVIHLVRDRLFARAEASDPLPFALAAALAPIVASLAALLWAVPQLGPNDTLVGPELFSAMLVFALGDMLGVLLLAPPILWLVQRLNPYASRPSPKVLVSRWPEVALVLALAWLLVFFIQEVDLGVVLAPVLLGTCWAGLRGGRPAAWLAILLSALIVLPLSTGAAGDVQRLHAHMLLACIAAGGYIAGSYADAQAIARAEIRRRDRLLLHAERLKTLRAMSLGVIHEVSQPLSTIALEANSLLSATAARQPDLAEVRDMSERIARKAQDLSELIRRLRSFGEGAGEGRTTVSAFHLLDELLRMTATQAEHEGVRLELRGGSDAILSVNEVEIRQALLNLVRNAINASPRPGGTIWLGVSHVGEHALFSVENRVDPAAGRRSGMGIGLSIVQIVAQSHGGELRVDRPGTGRVRCILQLPLAGE
ncbi:ATP-binding protein [Sphingomonas arenae]|uniref:ATP-binding protein n=1 Tax=Sphingomonas arenae TaxID=2812555 RepID=UPI001967BFC7|nr:ATP-binding protein [Sphingomonas arenae]